MILARKASLVVSTSLATVLLIVLALLPLSVSAVITEPVEHIRNGGFEEPLKVTEDPFDPELTWTPRNFGWATLSISTDMSHAGASSLMTTARLGFWAGPTQAFDLVGGKEYTVSLWVRLPAATADTLVVLCFNDALGNNLTAWDYSVVASASEWRQITGTYTPAADVTGAFISFLTYLNSDYSASATDFYLDDVSITTEEPAVLPVGDNMIRNPGFEEPLKETEDPFDPELTWTPRSFSWATLTIFTEAARTGTSSLRTTDRLGFWAGPTQGFDLVAGTRYYVSAWVRMEPLDPANLIVLCLNDSLGTT